VKQLTIWGTTVSSATGAKAEVGERQQVGQEARSPPKTGPSHGRVLRRGGQIRFMFMKNTLGKVGVGLQGCSLDEGGSF
jgi:hypothetical protein